MYDNSSCHIGSVSYADPPGGADSYGRSHRGPVLCVCVGGVSGASVECRCVGVSVRDLVCFDGGLTGLANSEVCVRFTRQNQ